MHMGSFSISWVQHVELLTLNGRYRMEAKLNSWTICSYTMTSYFFFCADLCVEWSCLIYVLHNALADGQINHAISMLFSFTILYSSILLLTIGGAIYGWTHVVEFVLPQSDSWDNALLLNDYWLVLVTCDRLHFVACNIYFFILINWNFPLQILSSDFLCSSEFLSLLLMS